MASEVTDPPAVLPAVPPATPATPPAAASPTPDDPNPPWLPQRLKEARQAERSGLLKELGVEKKEDLLAKLTKLNELETASLSEKEKAEKLISDLKPKAEIADAALTTLKEVIGAQFDALPEQVRTAIDAKANGDPAKRWEFMSMMSAAGIGGVPATPAAPVAPKPASTTPAAPPPPAPGTPKSAHDTWRDLQKTDGIAASLYYQANAQRIEQSRPTAA